MGPSCRHKFAFGPRSGGDESAYDGQSLFIVDRETIRQVDRVTMKVSTLAGRVGCRSWIDRAQSRAAFMAPMGIAYSAATRSLLVTKGGTIREIR
jgi:hypothetical protein